jgi:very-short-patch-repair endonuclease
MGKRKYTLEIVKQIFKDQKCELISTEYINPRTKLDYICNCGNISSITFDHFKRGVRCKKCQGKHLSLLYSLSFDFVKKEFEKNNCILLSTEYINCDTKLNYICQCGSTSEISYDSFRRGSRCMKCSGTEKLTYDFVKKEFEKNNCKLLSTEYINAYTKLHYLCKCENKSKITYSHFKNGRRCNMCKNKTEKIVSEFLESKYTNIISQPKFEWCKNITYLPFDFLLDNEKIIIEVDGGQHFKQVSNWKSPEETQKGDIFKMKSALEHGYHIIRIFQEDIFNNTIDWKLLITQAIDNLNNLNKPQVIYISKDPQLYNNYKLLENF